MHSYEMKSDRISESLMMERRITLRLLGYWEKLRGQRDMPTSKEVDPGDLQDLWDCCMLVHTHELASANNDYTYIGQSIIDVFGSGGQGEENGHSNSLLAGFNNSSLMMGCRKVVESRKPLIDEGEFYNSRQQLIKYRLCLLPLGDGQDVDAVFGGMRFKIYHS